MKTKTTKSTFSLSGIVCSAVGHNYVVSRKITNHISEYKCTRCGKEVTTTYSGRLEGLTVKTKEANTSLALFFQKKKRKHYTLPYEKADMKDRQELPEGLKKQLAS